MSCFLGAREVKGRRVGLRFRSGQGQSSRYDRRRRRFGDPAEIPRLRRRFVDGADFAKGTQFAMSRRQRRHHAPGRLGNGVLTGFFNGATGGSTLITVSVNVFWREFVPVLGLDASSPSRARTEEPFPGTASKTNSRIVLRVAKAARGSTEVPSHETRGPWREQPQRVSDVSACCEPSLAGAGRMAPVLPWHLSRCPWQAPSRPGGRVGPIGEGTCSRPLSLNGDVRTRTIEGPDLGGPGVISGARLASACLTPY